jgi:malate permease and related proteins
MAILATLLPLGILIALGAALARVGFLGRPFMADLNRLAFWIALPALLFTSAGGAAPTDGRLPALLGVMLSGTTLVAALAAVLGRLCGLEAAARGTFVQAAFRGNLAYIGVPVLSTSLGGDTAALGRAVLVMVLVMAAYNLLAVIVLTRADGPAAGGSLPRMLRSIVTNPLLIAGLLGLAIPFSGIVLPRFLEKSLDLLGAAAIPVALLCIGGALATTPVRGSRGWILAAALLKVAVLPGIVFALGTLAGLGPRDLRIAVVLAASPTAAAAFVMARQMGGDEPLASGSIALSTALSAASLAAALAATAG